MNEFRFYTWTSIFLITAGSMICVIGIYIILKKYKLLGKENVELKDLNINDI